MLDIIMRTAAANASRQFESLDNVATNVANFNTSGYKVRRFEQYLTSDDRLDGATRVDTSNGLHGITKREMDVAIEGPGYIPITQPDGTTAYTRDGSFALNSQGMIVTNHGDLVGEGMQVPVGYKKIQFKPDGSVWVQTAEQADFKPIGKITMVQFTNPEKLKSLGYNKLQVSQDSGEALPDGESRLKQGFLERSNVDIHTQIGTVLRLNASVISNLRIIKFADDLYRQSVNLKQ